MALVSLHHIDPEDMVTLPGWKWNDIVNEITQLRRAMRLPHEIAADKNGALHADVTNRMSYHPVTPQTKDLFEANRTEFLILAHNVIDRVPAGRHQAACLTALQEALMWANAAVACDTP